MKGFLRGLVSLALLLAIFWLQYWLMLPAIILWTFSALLAVFLLVLIFLIAAQPSLEPLIALLQYFGFEGGHFETSGFGWILKLFSAFALVLAFVTLVVRQRYNIDLEKKLSFRLRTWLLALAGLYAFIVLCIYVVFWIDGRGELDANSALVFVFFYGLTAAMTALAYGAYHESIALRRLIAKYISS